MRQAHLFSSIARLQEGAAKRPHGGETRERARDRRERETSQARNAGRRRWAVLLYSAPAQGRLLRVRSPMAPQGTPERGAKAFRHRRPTLYSGDPEGVSKHPPSGNGVGFADARLGAGYVSAPAAIQTQTPVRLPNGPGCVPAGSPKRSKPRRKEVIRKR
jgi:hypothetical protein